MPNAVISGDPQFFDMLFGDCLKIMPSFPAASIDLILCDLPYGTTACEWDIVIPFAPLWKEYLRILKPNGVICLTSAGKFTTVLNASNLEMLKYDYIWDKVRGVGHLNAKKKPLQRHETVSVFAAAPMGQFTYNPQMTTGKYRQKGGYGKGGGCYSNHGANIHADDQYYPSSILQFSNADQTNKIHPTQKPVALMEYLILTHSNEGDLVLDNCSGGGTTGVACINTNRRFIGIERDAEHYKNGFERVILAKARRENRTGLFA